jgi:hypothetical protein
MTCGPASFPARCYGSGGGSVRPFPVGGRSETGPGPRLLEALFDPLVRDQALDPALAVYADIGAEAPQPSVGQLADQLIAEGKRAILLLDNCPRETHDAVAPVCKSAGSTIGLITVDLDIRDENPEHTDIFRLQNASAAVIETLLERRYPDLSQEIRLVGLAIDARERESAGLMAEP